LSRIKKLLTTLSMLAMGVVVQCGDHDDDEDYEEERRSSIRFSAHLEQTGGVVDGPVVLAHHRFRADLK
jgi:hypothetical protein